MVAAIYLEACNNPRHILTPAAAAAVNSAGYFSAHFNTHSMKIYCESASFTGKQRLGVSG